MPVSSGPELLLRWFQLFVSIAYPVVVATLLLLAWLDWHRWVNHQLERDEDERLLEAEVKEFIE